MIQTAHDVLSLPSVFATFKGFRDLPEAKGVYFVVNGDDQILYIGRSANIQSRWFSHHKKHKAINFNCRVFYLELPDHIEIKDLERSLIKLFDPCWNNDKPPSRSQQSIKHTINIPDPLDRRIVALSEANPMTIAERERVTYSAALREALLRGVESLEREVKREGKS